ncbi:hypothetical protein [Noviherbaspirillum pedocola]|uniref:Uncharacterized protein n=1 Tax=Noviherbaspirillum pedocola TaxID=2801341 RepID=A0A934W7U1_9BURK|nr:hypothetical protein [Noviherbaspirillum pedocola]MBK4737832.1 hypothetical protein [Noviherbaspirillum pedocola]
MSENNNVSAASAPSAPAASRTTGVSLLTTCIIAAAFSAFSGMVTWHFASQSATGTPVAVIDSAKIAREAMNTTLVQPGMNPDKATAAANAFVDKLNNTLEEYARAGVVVVNSSVALTHPAGNDITQDIAAKLGVKLK